MTYQRQLRKALSAGLIKTGEVTQVTVEHEDGCRVWKTNRCTCQPSIRILAGSRVVTLGEDGEPNTEERTQ